MLTVLHEESALAGTSGVGRDTTASVDAARAAGLAVVEFSSDFELWGSAAEAFEAIEARPAPVPAVWLGYIPSPERYQAVYAEASGRNLWLLNSPEEHLRAMEFPRFYPRLEGLTARSVVLTSEDDCATVPAQLEFPVFVKGAVQSLKSKGFEACIARSPQELRALVTTLLSQEKLARGQVIVRDLLLLRHEQRDARGFPRGREFRVFCLRGEPLSVSYYWPDEDPLMALSSDEEQAVRALAREAAVRVGTPFLAVDVGQCDDGSWWVIEVGDAQFAGALRADRVALFRALAAQLAG